MSNMENQMDINAILKYLGSFALLIAIFPYSVLTIGAAIIDSAAIKIVTKLLYLLGFLGFVLAILSYIIGNEKQTKIFFAGSILITSISLLAVDFDKISDTGTYIGMVLMYLILGVIMLFLFMKEETFDENLKNYIWMGIGIIYLIAIIMQAVYEVGGFDNITFDAILTYNFIIPQTIVMGGIFGFFVALIILIKPIMKMINLSEDIMKIIDLLLIFSIALGILFEIYGRLVPLYTATLVVAPPTGIFGILFLFGNILIMGQLFYALLTAALILHIIQKYA
ncbi:MAG: hypothetical protein Q6363_001345 [Candidatus Njordarchaeota archaeon]